jgi:hypothetical protein
MLAARVRWELTTTPNDVRPAPDTSNGCSGIPARVRKWGPIPLGWQAGRSAPQRAFRAEKVGTGTGCVTRGPTRSAISKPRVESFEMARLPTTAVPALAAVSSGGSCDVQNAHRRGDRIWLRHSGQFFSSGPRQLPRP